MCMGKLTRRETCKRSFFGWVFLILFLLFNALMLLWLVGYWSMLSGYVERPNLDAWAKRWAALSPAALF